MAAPHYSRINQLRREVALQYHASEWRDLAMGIGIVLASFYAFHRPGVSQVYNVITPYAMAAAYLVYTILLQIKVERDDRSATFFAMLPRDPAPAFDGKVLWYALQATLYQAVIAVGCFLKLGGADVTPVYRLHPEVVVLPYVAVLFALWIAHVLSDPDRTLNTVVALFVGFVFLLLRIAALPDATPENNWLPPRAMPLSYGYITAGVVLLTALGLALSMRTKHRRYWGQP